MKFAGWFTGLLTPGTVRASKAVVTNSTKDITGLRNNTITGRSQWLTQGPSSGEVAAGAALAVSAALHAGRTIRLETLAGSVCTLPAATGSGNRYRFRVGVLATSVSHIIKVTGTDIMQGLILGARTDSGNAVLGFACAADSDTITLNRTTTGSVNLGEFVECEDVAAGVWQVNGLLSATGAAFATPFSATVP